MGNSSIGVGGPAAGAFLGLIVGGIGGAIGGQFIITITVSSLI